MLANACTILPAMTTRKTIAAVFSRDPNVRTCGATSRSFTAIRSAPIVTTVTQKMKSAQV